MTAPIPPDVTRQLEQLVERVLQRYVSSAPTRNLSSGPLSIREGEVTIAYPDELGGGAAVYFGPLYSSIDGDYIGSGLVVFDTAGQAIASFRWDTTFNAALAQLFDGAGNAVIATDAISKQGMARPYVPGALHRARYGDWTVQTTSAVFETLWAGRLPKQQPRLVVGVRASMDTTATTGELRVLVNGTPLGTTQSVAFAQGYYVFGPAAVAGEHMADLDVEVQARRTSATGAMRVEPWYGPSGRQS